MKELQYFRCTPLYYWAGLVLGLGTLLIGVFCPEVVPYNLLGPLGNFLYYMNYSQQALLKGLVVFTIVAHGGEGIYAFVLTRRMNLTTRDSILWTAQTTILGFSSLMPLRAKYLQILKEK